VKEVDQYGEERYWVTEPDGMTYLRDASKIYEANDKGLETQPAKMKPE